MTKARFIDLFAFILCLIPFVTWFILRDSLPEQLPIHWNAKGEVDGWTSKERLPFFLLFITAIGAMTYLLLRFIKQIDPKRSAQLNETTALKAGTGIIIFTTGINLLLLVPQREPFNQTTIILVMVSLMFAFFGNVMYDIKPNYFIGIRVPWTLESDDNWKNTHRLAGIVWSIGGILSAILSLFLLPNVMFPIFIGITTLLVLIPIVYSFILFRQSKTGR